MTEISEIISKYNLKFCAVQDGEWSHILLTYPYNPFKPLGKNFAYIDAYYLASNKLYNISKQIKQDLTACGYETDDFHLSLKPLGERGGLGKILNNRLLTNAYYGSKMTLQAISVKTNFELLLNELPADLCLSCGKCDKACPVGALNKGDFNRDICLRNIQDFPQMTSPCMSNKILGCEDCQKACPHNAKILEVDMPDDLKTLLEIKNLKTMAMGGKNGYAKLSEYIGSNYARAKYIKRILLLNN